MTIERPFRYPFQVTLHDVDAAGVLFFSHLLRHAHDAYEAFMQELGFALPQILAKGDLLLPIAHTEADFFQPIHHGEHIIVTPRVERIGRHSFTLKYRFINQQEQLSAEAQTVHVAMARQSTGPITLPEPLKTVLTIYSSD